MGHALVFGQSNRILYENGGKPEGFFPGCWYSSAEKHAHMQRPTLNLETDGSKTGTLSVSTNTESGFSVLTCPGAIASRLVLLV